jgi:hypothetical protein
MKMKSYATFTEYTQAQTPRNQAMIRALRTLVKNTAPGLEETVKWGNGCWVKGDEPVAFVYSRAEYLEFGFFSGTALDDPAGLLEGKGQYVRHVKMRAPADTRRGGVARLLRQAARLAGERAGPTRTRDRGS